MMIIQVLQLICLLGIIYFLFKLVRLVPELLSRLEELNKVIKVLDRKETVGHYTITEARENYIRISSILREWINYLSKVLSSEIMKGLGGK